MQDCNVFASKLKIDELRLSKIMRIGATRCHILKLKCIKFDFGCEGCLVFSVQFVGNPRYREGY